MRPYIRPKEGDTVGDGKIIFLRDLPFIYPERRKALFRCLCGKEFIAVIAEAKHNRIKKCKECWRKDRFEKFISKSKIIHGNRYDYSYVNYISATDKVEIVCKTHGLFWQTPDNHTHGKGCPICNKKNWRLKDEWITCTKGKTCYLYLANYFNEIESFLKIGITSQESPSIRVKRNNPYKFNIIGQITGDAMFIYDCERDVLKLFKSYKYAPLLKFGGQTECFEYTIKETILSYMQLMMPTAR